MAIDRATFDRANFTDSRGKGRLGRRLLLGQYNVPHVTRIGDSLEWAFLDHPENWKAINSQELLTRFLNLETDDDVENFARSHGILGLQRIKPDAERWANDLQYGDERWMLPERWPPNGEEPLYMWRALVREFAAAVRIAADLNANPPAMGDRRNWDLLGLTLDPKETIEEARMWYCLWFNRWLRIGRVGFELDYDDAPKPNFLPALRFHGDFYLIGALMLQIMTVIAGKILILPCSHCLKFHTRDRRPREGAGAYCSVCAKSGKRQDEAERKRKERMKTAKKLRRQGLPLRQIAAQLKITVEQAKRWTIRTPIGR
jgi:transposase-like protein